MVIDNKQESLELIETALHDIYDEDVSTSVLLLKCQRISILLDSKQENEWIWHELEGYETDEDVPNYRLVTMQGIIESARVVGGGRDKQMLLSAQLKGKDMDYQFQVSAPLHYLEKSNERLKFKDKIKLPVSKENPLEMLLGHYTIMKPVEIDVVAWIPIGTMRSIASAVRIRIHEYLLTQKTALLLQPHLQGIFDETMNLIASKLSTLDPDLLEELRNLVKKLQSKSKLDWRNIADACRTIIQGFTDLIYIDEMIPNGEIRPAHDRTRDKCRQIAIWALSQINMRIDESPEASRIERLPSYLDDYYEMIIRSVEKVKHKDTKTLRKDEVDRVAIYTILWLADLIQLLNRADYSWPQSGSKN